MESCAVRHAHTYKGEKYLARRLEEVNNTASWNALYLNNDTVMKVGVKTSDILDVESGNMAVRVALAETEVLEDTKKWLESQHVQIEVLEVLFSVACLSNSRLLRVESRFSEAIKSFW